MTFNIDCRVCRAKETIEAEDIRAARPRLLIFMMVHMPCLGGKPLKVDLEGHTDDGTVERLTFTTRKTP